MHQTFRFLRCALCLLALVGGLVAPAGMTRVESRSVVLPNAETLPISPLADFQQVKKLASNVSLEASGYSVAISGDTMVVGAYHFSQTPRIVYVYERGFDPEHPDIPKPGNWGLVKTLTPADTVTGAGFGLSVAISGDILAVSAPITSGGAASDSAVYIFARNYDPDHPTVPLANNWGQVKKLTSDGVSEAFTSSISINTDTLAVGSVCSVNEYYEGCPRATVYIFSRNYNPDAPEISLTDNWGLLKKISAGQDLNSIAIEGDLLITGSRHGSNDPTNQDYQKGAADIYMRNYNPADPTKPAANNWGLIKHLRASDAVAEDDFGYAVAIGGNTVAVGAPCKPRDVERLRCGPGAVYVFSRDYDPDHPDTPLTNYWGQVKKLVASDGRQGDRFGSSIVLSSSILFVGAYDHPYGTNPVPGPGAVYVFDNSFDPNNPTVFKTNNWGLVRKLIADDGKDDSTFGMSISISGDTLSIGAPGDGNLSEGAAYIFERDVSRIFIPLVGKHD